MRLLSPFRRPPTTLVWMVHRLCNAGEKQAQNKQCEMMLDGNERAHFAALICISHLSMFTKSALQQSKVLGAPHTITFSQVNISAGRNINTFYVPISHSDLTTTCSWSTGILYWLRCSLDFWLQFWVNVWSALMRSKLVTSVHTAKTVKVYLGSF